MQLAIDGVLRQFVHNRSIGPHFHQAASPVEEYHVAVGAARGAQRHVDRAPVPDDVPAGVHRGIAAKAMRIEKVRQDERCCRRTRGAQPDTCEVRRQRLGAERAFGAGADDAIEVGAIGAQAGQRNAVCRRACGIYQQTLRRVGPVFDAHRGGVFEFDVERLHEGTGPSGVVDAHLRRLDQRGAAGQSDEGEREGTPHAVGPRGRSLLRSHRLSSAPVPRRATVRSTPPAGSGYYVRTG